MNQDGTHFATFDLLRHPAPTKFDLNQLIQKLARLRQHEHHHRKIAVILDLATELPNTSADGSQIECVLLTLFARSRDAIIEAKRPHGTITLRTRLKAGRIQFSITDDGLPDASSGLFGTLFTRPLEEDVNLTTCAEIVQEQDGELYAWRPHHSASRTIIMDLPAGV
jgi:nitrogen fixation/metabolism regulation signal transduction histidine kinase